MLKVGIICGGPSHERGISLNSARSLMDHLQSNDIEVFPFYVDFNKEFYEISKAQLYSNTPSDFAFKLAQDAKKLSDESLSKKLQSLDIIFPVIHGSFGEDGELQSFLEKLEVPFIGSNSQSCRKLFHKYDASQFLKEKGFEIIPSLLIKKEIGIDKKKIQEFFKAQAINQAVVKPVKGGSSIGVFVVDSVETIIEKAIYLFENGYGNEVILEPFCEGKEFTVVVLQEVDSKKATALIPTEVEFNKDDGQIFDYRKKYLPTAATRYHTPARFPINAILEIQAQAERIFKLFKMRDFARFDGWILNDGRICFSDLQPISGLEQNSFLFRQASLSGFTHQEVLNKILECACAREKLNFPKSQKATSFFKKQVYVLFGGTTSERQVSLMSGTNVWLKLLKSNKYEAHACLYDQNGNVWFLPYSYALNHTVEEIYENCIHAEASQAKLKELSIFHKNNFGFENRIPLKLTLEEFLEKARQNEAFVFLGLHGGAGEDGTLQNHLEQLRLSYNGSGPEASALCMDKLKSGKIINSLKIPEICSLPKLTIDVACISEKEIEDIWKNVLRKHPQEDLIIKPRSEGCSSGIVKISTLQDLRKYIDIIKSNASFIAPGTFKDQIDIVEISGIKGTEYIIEPFIETDKIIIKNNKLFYKPKTGWLELTIGILEAHGIYKALKPSIAVTEGHILSLEEKFQGGTGINITPPPESIIPNSGRKKIKESTEIIAKALKIENYARIDLFFNTKTEKVVFIEANSLPALTASTVIFHQALAENPTIYPIEFLERLIESKLFSKEQTPVLTVGSCE